MKTSSLLARLFQPLASAGLRLANVPTLQQFNITPNLATDDHWQTISGRKHDRYLVRNPGAVHRCAHRLA